MIPGNFHFAVVHDSLDHGEVDADELEFWVGRAVTEDVEDDNTQRTNCRQLLASMLSFLEHPQGSRYLSAADLCAAASDLRDAIRDVLTVDLERRARRSSSAGISQYR